MKKITCALAFLPGDSSNLNKHGNDILTLIKAEQLAHNIPIHYMWINATCHSYLLKDYNIDSKSLPIITYINTET